MPQPQMATGHVMDPDGKRTARFITTGDHAMVTP